MTTDAADTAREVMAAAQRAGMFPPRAIVVDIEEVPPRFRGQKVKVLDLVASKSRGLTALVELEGSSACTTMNVPPQHLRFRKIKTPPEPPSSPFWERSLHRSAMLTANVLWKLGDGIDWVARRIERGGTVVHDAGHAVLDGAIQLTNKIRGWDDD